MINNSNSGYVVAGADTYVSLFSLFFSPEKQGQLYIPENNLSHFMYENINRFLYSFGTPLDYKKKKLHPKHQERFIKSVEKCVNQEFMNETVVYWDSGGYQVSMGAIETSQMIPFIDLYIDTMLKHPDKFSYAFCLDLPPGPGSKDIFDSYKEVENLNRISYSKFAQLPQAVKDKTIYVHHFRTPSLFKIWNKFLFDEKLAKGFNYFATGGIVANSSTDKKIPIILYTIPLSSILYYAKQEKMKKFKFHILGGANNLDVFYHKLFSYHIKQYHDIDVEITYDSTGLFKGFAIGRFLSIFDKFKNLVKISIKSSDLNLCINNEISAEDKIYQCFNELAQLYKFKQLNKIDTPIYMPITDGMNRPILMYGLCYVMYIYKKLEDLCTEFIVKNYSLYRNGDYERFDRECLNFSQFINGGSITDKHYIKINSLHDSLKLLEKLDLAHDEHIVKKYMEADEMSMFHNKSILDFDV